MTGLAIAVLTEDENYGKALARGLAEESERVRVKAVCTKGMADGEFLSEAEKLSDEGSVLLTGGRPRQYRDPLYFFREKNRRLMKIVFLSCRL